MNPHRDITASGRVVVVAEHRQGRILEVTWEILACGRELARALDTQLTLVVLGARVEALGREAARLCGEAVTVLDIPGPDTVNGEAQRRLLIQVLPDLEARVVVGAHTTSGLDWAPGLAVRMGAGFVSGVEAVENDGAGLIFKRTGHHGKLMEKLRLVGERLVITVEAGAFKSVLGESASSGQGPAGPVEIMHLEPPDCQTQVEDAPDEPVRDAALSLAQVVVAAGRGVGKKENLYLLRELASLFSNAALAGSRPVCELGWLGFQSQIGQTGATVAPGLYIACGISGAGQHTAGMKGSQFIVAINRDPSAAIHNASDVCVVEDLTVFIPVFLKLAGHNTDKEKSEPEPLDRA